MLKRQTGLLLALCLFAWPAFAGGDVCLIDNGNEAAFALKKLKLPKRPGDAVPVTGIGITSTSVSPLPLSGTLILDLEGNLLLGLTRHFQRCLVSIVLDESLSGTVAYDCNLDNVDDTTGTVAPVDCAIVLPIQPLP